MSQDSSKPSKHHRCIAGADGDIGFVPTVTDRVNRFPVAPRTARWTAAIRCHATIFEQSAPQKALSETLHKKRDE